MKNWCLFIMLAVITISGCGAGSEESSEMISYESVSLFCDVEFWDAPIWDVSENTVSGRITKETGAVIEVVDKMEDADKQLSIMLVNGKLPDLISVTDSTVISQLVTSDKVWKLDEFLEIYKPDSHLLQSFPEDIKYELIKRDGGWYAYPSHMSSPDNRERWSLDEYYLDEKQSRGEDDSPSGGWRVLSGFYLGVSDVHLRRGKCG